MKGTKLKIELVKMGVTQTWLASQAGIPVTTLHMIANGRVTPNVKTALKIAKAIGLSVDYLWGDDDN